MSEMEIAAEATNFASLLLDEIQLPWTHCMFFFEVEVTSFIPLVPLFLSFRQKGYT